MTSATINTGSAAASRAKGVSSTGLGRLIARVTARGRRSATRRALRALSPEQLRDAGIGADQVFAGPVHQVDATTMSNLMTVR